MINPEIYARAIYELANEGKDAGAVVEGVKKSLIKRGALKLLPQILNMYKHLVLKNANNRAVLIVASEMDKKLIEKHSFYEKDMQVRIDPNIVGGYRIEKQGKLTDASFKSKLLQIYERATRGDY